MMAHANAGRAGVSDYFQFKCQAFSSITLPARQGWVVTNPLYEVGVSDGNKLGNLYAHFAMFYAGSVTAEMRRYYARIPVCLARCR
jgi:23S rRNA G2445 N2-methylase RlmL